MAGREWFVLSDLHLDEQPARRDVDRALPAFLEQVVGASTTTERTLVLLGDTFDLDGPVRRPTAAVADRLARVAAAHPRVVGALAEGVRAGVDLHVVGGNHDVELARPAVARTLVSLLGLPEGDPGVRFSPWLVHVPGILYAEHGHQHHGLHRMPTLLAVADDTDDTDDADRLPVPPLAAAGDGHPGCRPDSPRAARVARALWASRRQERETGSPWYAARLARQAERLDLPEAALADLAATSPFGPLRSVGGAAWRSAQRRTGRAAPGAHLAGRARAVHRVLSRHGAPVAAYVFGHDHRAVRIALPGPPPAAYLNAGTWSDDVRSRGPDVVDRGLLPYVRVVAGPDGVRADLTYWNWSRRAPSP